MRGSPRLVATLKIDVEFMENHAERLFALVPHITDTKAKQDCLELAKEIEAKTAEMRARVDELEEGA